MIFEGSQAVIEAIKEKQRLQAEGKSSDHIRPMLFVDGGLMKGSYGVGAALALEELGYKDVFSNVVGVSSGAPTAAYFLAGEMEIGAGLVWDECCTKKLINVWRFWNQVNTAYFSQVIRGETGRGLNAEAALEGKASLYMAVSNFKTGEPRLIKPETEEELYSSIQASILMPNVSTDIVEFDDIRYVDGGFTRPHALRKAAEEISATHILVITNQDQSVTKIPRLERWLNNTLYRKRMPKPLRFAAHERKQERMKAIEYINEELNIPCALVWGDHSIRSMERDSQVVRKVVEKSRLWWRELLD